MGFLYVIAWKSELETGGKVDSWIEELLSGLHKYNIRVFVEKNKEKGKDIVKQALKEHGLKPEDGLLLAASDNLLQQAEETGLATIGFLNPEWKNQTYRKAQILVEGFEEVDFYFLERIYNRKHHIPWRVIDTKRCYLREMTMDDLDDLYALYAGEGMIEFMEPLYEDREEEAAYTKAYIDNQYYYYGYGMWLVIDRETNKLIGRAGLDNHEIHGKIELEMGYAIAKEKQRQGYGFEVCSAILTFAKEFLEFERVNCLVEKENEASIRLLQKLEFSRIEEMNLDGKKMQRYVRHLTTI